MKASGTKIGRLIIGCFLAFSLTQELNAQLIPPGGGGGSGGDYTNSYSSGVINTNFLISVQNTNIVLNWHSATNKIFLLENRTTLTGGSWGELTNYYLSSANTNWTKFIHTNILKAQQTGFYRLFNVTPVANADFYSVDQDSSANQFDILQNDTCPNDDKVIITNLVSAQHGGISYTPDASTFEYTPDAGFYGVDTFAYSITSQHGEISSNATVTVFVNQSGNNPPVVPDIVVTLQTNVHTFTFNALTNATDPDGDTVILFSVNAPNLGSVSNDASGNITYTRNPSLFGSDSFTYVVTDGNGGYGVGNVKILQVDSDGDGMPDEWEMANGIDPFNDDSMADPDNDGLPNLAEFELGTNPHSSDNPLNFPSVTNGMQISGFAQLPIYGINPRVSPPPINFYANSNAAAYSFVSQAADGQWNMDWDTTFFTNGTYQIQLGCQVATPSSPDSINNLFGAIKSVQVFNPITFDSFTSTFKDFLLVYGKLAVTNSTYDVYLYDDNNGLLVYATGLSAPNGQIALYWDLTDGQGYQISFDDIQATFTIHPPINQGQAQPRDAQNSPQVQHRFHKDVGSINKNTFAVAWGWNFYSGNLTDSRVQLMENGVINILGNPAEDSYTLYPVENVPYADMAFRYDDDSDKEMLKHALNVSGNFFWFGHGDSSDIGGNMLKSAIVSDDVETLLENKAFRSTAKHSYKNKNPYFLTILNACQTYSPDWSGAFGVNFADHNSYADYVNTGRPPRAFVGWSTTVHVPSNFDLGQIEHGQYAEALGYLFGDWMIGYPLNYCLGDFSNNALNSTPAFTGADSWTISGCYDLERGD